jgi:hypothetical protein
MIYFLCIINIFVICVTNFLLFSSGNKRDFSQSIRECNLNVLDESMAIRDKEKRLLTLATDWYNAIGMVDYYPFPSYQYTICRITRLWNFGP